MAHGECNELSKLTLQVNILFVLFPHQHFILQSYGHLIDIKASGLLQKGSNTSILAVYKYSIST